MTISSGTTTKRSSPSFRKPEQLGQCQRTRNTDSSIQRAAQAGIINPQVEEFSNRRQIPAHSRTLHARRPRRHTHVGYPRDSSFVATDLTSLSETLSYTLPSQNSLYAVPQFPRLATLRSTNLFQITRTCTRAVTLRSPRPRPSRCFQSFMVCRHLPRAVPLQCPSLFKSKSQA